MRLDDLEAQEKAFAQKQTLSWLVWLFGIGDDLVNLGKGDFVDLGLGMMERGPRMEIVFGSISIIA